ncbi:hypothetical protein ACIBI4_01530 [Streptomyces sp. NPDC050418]|uniref:hypothetical protein n=1 Tax=Streptomyces sp. NPDC050418 TaxID=3365612 RepID=UPI0037A30B22
MYVMAVSTVADERKFWDALKRAHAKLPKGSEWKLAVSGGDGVKAVNVITHESVAGLREFMEAHAGAYATTEYFEADAANAIGLAR